MDKDTIISKMVGKDILSKFGFIPRKTKDFINIDPLQRGGILTQEAKKALIEWGDGYSVCDFCTKGLLREIKTPPIYDFVYEALPAFLDIDSARITQGAREGKYIVMNAICDEGDWILIDENAHYTSFVAGERRRLKIKKVKNTGYPEYLILPDAYLEAILELKKEGIKPKLAVVTYPDGNYGNLPDAKRIVQICHEYEIPVILNCAYSIGRMAISCKEFDPDFIVASGHKSMASCGPIGILGFKKEFEEKIARKSELYKVKEVEELGCTVRGAPLMTLIASFPKVVERTKDWQHEVEKTNYVISKLQEVGLKHLGEKPHKHDLVFFEAEDIYQYTKMNKKGYFLYEQLKKRKIFGIKPGLNRHFKLSVYGLSWQEVESVISAFKEISEIIK